MEAYPDAKVLLACRAGDAWAHSMSRTIWDVLYGDSTMADLSAARCRVDPGWSSYIELMKAMWQKRGLLTGMEVSIDKDALAKNMERYNEEVIQTVPSDRLLVWSPSDGWEPLCEFWTCPCRSPRFRTSTTLRGSST